MPDVAVIIHNYQLDPKTGRIELHLKCKSAEDNVTWEGEVKQYSCDLQTLRDRFNGDLDTFISWAAREHRSLVGAKPGMAEALEQRKGKAI